ncbi:hypothetical protein, similarity to Flp pilus assembly protein TadG [Aromatoleum aromaticum EbN1]|uniref:TadE-like domain-containing protein n=1 Tax=Aromatoleum aromaticum (strain DSM 19018 / LMG 30748 / EbN1) TaxID=76114 RepID=Q5P3A1_AROAE|nr:TadE family protein [Aromatoleum aromaticum]CAI08213.1 hypothetical protein, similarity to Flp pilus assembly protein TadG [Aromatoleum aromaticum EbN1]
MRHMRGVVAVEFAFLLIPLVMLGFGITEFGRAIYSYNTLAKAVRDAARHLTAKTPGDPVEHAIAKCMAVHGNPDCNGPALAPDLKTSMVQTCDTILSCPGVENTVTTGTGMINTVTVRISGYPYNSVVEYVMPDITFNNIAVTMRSQL